MTTFALNKDANRNYEFLEKFEGGLKLTGAEVKSVRAGHVNLKGSFLSINNNHLIIKGMHIGKYAPAGQQEDYDPIRPKIVLVNKKELNYLIGQNQAKGLTIVPISVYNKGNFIKLNFAIARGKKQFEKREDLKKRDIQKQLRQAMKNG
jgi:SsrA-binding protein